MFFLCRNSGLAFILLFTFRVSHWLLVLFHLICNLRMWPLNVVWFVYFRRWCLVLKPSFLCLETIGIDLVLSSPKRVLSLLSTNYQQMFVKPLSNCFSISITSFPWKARQKSSAYRNKFDLTAWGMSFTHMRNIKDLRLDPCGTLRVILEGSE